MVANVITFQQSVSKIYTILSPPVKDLDDFVAFIFMGPNPPTQDNYNCTPLLIRRNEVLEALNWLKLNHCEYSDLKISHRNLDGYPENIPPVVAVYQYRESNKILEAMSVHDMETEDGTRAEICPLTVHGITSEKYVDASTETLFESGCNGTSDQYWKVYCCW